MNIKQALKYKNKLAKKIQETAQKVARYNSVDEGVVRPYDVNELLAQLQTLTEEMVELIKLIQSEWVGVTLDFGNNISLLENPMEVIKTLAPYSFSTHVKDMGVQEYEKGFLLSEVPLGQGIVDLPAAVALCKKLNPSITFNLEMITRDPLKIPCLDAAYYETMGDISSSALAKTLAMVREKKFEGKLPQTSQLTGEQALAYEEKNIVDCLQFSKSKLGLG